MNENWKMQSNWPLIAALFVLVAVGGVASKCGHDVPTYKKPDTVMVALNRNGNAISVRLTHKDSIFRHGDTVIHFFDNGADTSIQPISYRYFLVSYVTRLKDDNTPDIEGDLTIESDLFPNKPQIDSIVYRSLIKKRKCYQDIVITNIFEFKNQSDYTAFNQNVKYKKEPKKKDPCCNNIESTYDSIPTGHSNEIKFFTPRNETGSLREYVIPITIKDTPLIFSPVIKLKGSNQ